jgi:hypothetical protein
VIPQHYGKSCCQEDNVAPDCPGDLMSKRRLVTAIGIIFSIVPILLFSRLPLVDYPNHLAELQIRKTITSNVHIASFYEFSWKFTPHLGLDLFATPFLPFFSVETTGRLVIVLSFGIICLGTLLLDRELNRDDWGLSLFSGIFLYNAAFMWGFISYIIGVGFAVLSFWLWVQYRDEAGPIRSVGFTVFAMIISVIHIWAFVIYGIWLAGYECSILWENRMIDRRLRVGQLRTSCAAAVTLILPLLAVVCLSSVSSNYKETVWGLEHWGASRFWGSLVTWKSEVFASPIYTGQNVMEKPLLITVLAIFVLALGTRTITINSRMRVPLAVSGVILIIMPNQLAGFWFTDYHLPSGFVFFALPSMAWRQTSRLKIKIVNLLLVICMIIRVGSIIWSWEPTQTIIEEYDRALKLVPPGSRLLVLFGSENVRLLHIPVLAAAKQGVFVPYTWTSESGVGWTGVYMLRVKPDFRHYLRDSPTALTSVRHVNRYDYLLEVGKIEAPIPDSVSLNEIARGQTFTLYRIEQAAVRSIVR